ncbi:MAG: lytic murein transglycosylase [Deltaproteobacteria bacterium]|nr:lytic murein transglycosylase [Deltaproteobacteria bacterium]
MTGACGRWRSIFPLLGCAVLLIGVAARAGESPDPAIAIDEPFPIELPAEPPNAAHRSASRIGPPGKEATRTEAERPAGREHRSEEAEADQKDRGAMPPKRPRGIVFVAVGDINMGTAFPSKDFLPPDGGRDLFKPVAGLLAGDVLFGNLEGPLADGGETRKCRRSRNCYAFRTPTAYVQNLKTAGFDVLSLANNHAMDFGEAGRQSTIEALEKAGIAYSGPVGKLASLEVRGRKIALVAFTSSEHSYNLLDIEAAVRTVGEQAASHDLVVVSFHGGSEGRKAAHVPDAMEHLGSEPRGHLIRFAHAVVDAGADLVLGHGPHLLRGAEIYRGRLVAYSLGNFCTYGRFNLTGPMGRAVVIEAELDATSGAFVRGRLHATIQRRPGGPRPDPSGGGIADVRALSRADFPYTAPEIDEKGRISPGPGPRAGLFTLDTTRDRAALRKLLDSLAANKGISKDALVRAFGDERARLEPEVLGRFARPAEKALSYERYRAIFLKDDVLAAGKKFLSQRAALLAEVEKAFGVERQVLAGLIATETRFGVHRGKMRVFNSLATQALRMRRRARWARAELRALMKVFAADPLAVKGSYAGAVGLVQFMPTSIRAYGMDWDKDGRIDLDAWPDALASAANYLKAKGWRAGEPIRRGRANYKALWGYNPAHHYVRVVAELAAAFGYEAHKKKGSKIDKPKPDKPKPDMPGTGKSGNTGKPGTDEPGAGKAGTGKPGTGTGKPGTGTGKPGTGTGGAGSVDKTVKAADEEADKAGKSSNTE